MMFYFIFFVVGIHSINKNKLNVKFFKKYLILQVFQDGVHYPRQDC